MNSIMRAITRRPILYAIDAIIVCLTMVELWDLWREWKNPPETSGSYAEVIGSIMMQATMPYLFIHALGLFLPIWIYIRLASHALDLALNRPWREKLAVTPLKPGRYLARVFALPFLSTTSPIWLSYPFLYVMLSGVFGFSATLLSATPIALCIMIVAGVFRMSLAQTSQSSFYLLFLMGAALVAGTQFLYFFVANYSINLGVSLNNETEDATVLVAANLALFLAIACAIYFTWRSILHRFLIIDGRKYAKESITVHATSCS